MKSFGEWWQERYDGTTIEQGMVCKRCGLTNVWALTTHAKNVHGDDLSDLDQTGLRPPSDRADFRGIRRPHTPEQVAQRLHEAYEELAPTFGYATRDESAVAWDDVPEPNRLLMLATVEKLIKDGVIRPGGL